MSETAQLQFDFRDMVSDWAPATGLLEQYDCPIADILKTTLDCWQAMQQAGGKLIDMQLPHQYVLSNVCDLLLYSHIDPKECSWDDVNDTAKIVKAVALRFYVFLEEYCQWFNIDDASKLEIKIVSWHSPFLTLEFLMSARRK